jgi:hypothetical protein
MSLAIHVVEVERKIKIVVKLVKVVVAVVKFDEYKILF